MLGTAAIIVGGPVGFVLASAALGGVLGGISNSITGGRFSAGVVNGAICGASIAVPGSAAGIIANYGLNFMGGFTGNFITEELNNLEGKNTKSISDIAITSVGVGTAQTIIGGGMGHITTNLGIQAASEPISYYLANAFSNLNGFGAGNSTYVGIDWTLKQSIN